MSALWRRLGPALVAASIFGSAIPAQADGAYRGSLKDRPVPVIMGWSGCYLGGYVGGAWSGNATAREQGGYNYGPAGGPTFGYDLDSGVIGGGTIGCNHQTGQFVLGIEGEFGYLGLDGSALDPNSPFLPLDTRASTTIDGYGVIAARLGVVMGDALLYVKGGLAFADVDRKVVDSNAAGGNTISATNSGWETGWALGGGVEYALGPQWSLKAEYLFIDIGAQTTCGTATVGGGTFCWDHDLDGIHTAKLGLNYRFGR